MIVDAAQPRLDAALQRRDGMLEEAWAAGRRCC
jgi:hypothetical protein